MKPMLAVAHEGPLSSLKYPLLASPKLDGIRCVIQGGKALSRSLKPIPNVGLRALLEQPELEGLDGELILDGGNFQQTTSAVMGRSVSLDVLASIQYHVFDYYPEGFANRSPNAPFMHRISLAAEKVSEYDQKWTNLKLVPHTVINDERDLNQYEEEQLALGHEGVMLRALDGPYKCGRSTLKEGWLLKLKRFTDAEAVIVGFEERMHNGNEATTNELGRTARSSAKAGKTGVDTLGAFVLERADGIRFNCGTGLDDAQRDNFWKQRDYLLGRLVKFKYQEHGTKDAPRSPVFLGIRDSADV